MAIEDKLRNYLQQFGRVNNNGNLIGVFLHLKKDNSYLTEEELDELFSKTEILYYFTDSKDINDYEQDEYVFRKGYIKAKVIKLNTNLNKYRFPIYINYNYNTRYNNYAGVFISDLQTIYERNFTPTSYRDEDVPNINSKLSAALSSIDTSQLSDNSPEPEKCDTTENTSPDKVYKPNEISEIVYNNIYDLEDWGINEEERKYKINKYIYYLKNAIENKLNNETLDSKYYHKYTSTTGTDYYIFNTRLLDKFGGWIYICYSSYKKINSFGKVVIVLDQDTYISNEVDLFHKGMEVSSDDLKKIKPIQFYENKADLVFDGEYEDFELEISNRNFTHIIEERRDRLPKELQGENIMEIVYRIKFTVEHAVKISKSDYNYIVPCYNIERDSIQYMIPLLTSFDKHTEAESVLLVNPVKDKFVISTVLKKDDAYEIARVLNRPTASWFR